MVYHSLLQGVTLTDLQEAEKTIGRSRPTKTREEEKEEKEKQDKEKQEEKKETETKEDDYRSKYRSFEEVCFLFLFFFNLPTQDGSPYLRLSSIFCLPISLKALPDFVFLLLHLFHSQHCLHPFLLEHHFVLQLPQQA